MNTREEFEALVQQNHPELSSRVKGLVGAFYEMVKNESEVQNLTRLIAPADFYRGHFIDCAEFVKLGDVGYPCLDLGSGLGVPGILVAILTSEIGKGKWVLAESELKKAEFLKSVVQRLGLSGYADVFYGRGEAFLASSRISNGQPFTVVSRAVGKVHKIYSWLRPSSTWNELVLFKGPGWAAEWAEFKEGKYTRELEIRSNHEYSIGAEGIIRKIITLRRIK